MSKTVELHVLKNYQIIREMGSGAYGHVWEVKDKKTGTKYALKKVFDAFRNQIDAQRTYRQVEVLSKVKHQNIIKLYKVIKAQNNKDLYLVFEYMEADLHSVVGTKILEKIHQIFIFHQILKGIKYLHSGEIIHRDLKPSNVLINSECATKLCDFGLVRSLVHTDHQQIILSEEVATKWYRAPQLLLGSRTYGKPIDMWSFGCIVSQILIGRPVFSGSSTLNQLQKILQYVGDIHHIDIQSLQSPVAQQLISQIKIKKKSFLDLFSGIDGQFYQLLKGTLQFNPNKRLTVDQALSLPIFKQLQDKFEICKSPIIPAVDDNMRLGVKLYRNKIYEQIKLKYNGALKQISCKRKISRHRPKTCSKQRSQSKNNKNNEKSKSGKTYSVKTVKSKTSISSMHVVSPPKKTSTKLFQPKDLNPISRYQSPKTRVLKKSSKNKVYQFEKKSILKSLGIKKTKHFYQYIK